MKCMLRTYVVLAILPSCTFAGTVTFTPEGGGESPIRTYSVVIDSLNSLPNSQWDGFDLVIGSNDGLLLTDFVFSAAVSPVLCTSTSFCGTNIPGPGVYGSDIKIGAHMQVDPQDVPFTLGILTVDTTGLSSGSYELKIDGISDSMQSAAANGLPLEALSGSIVVEVCDVASAPTKPTGEPGYAKNRYISMVPGDPGVVTALRVTLVSLDPCPNGGCDLSSLNGTTMWVGNESVFAEAPGSSSAPPSFKVASLVCAPEYKDWGAVGLVHVYGSQVVPNSIYEVQAVAQDCDDQNEAHYSSSPLVITTSLYGDVAGMNGVSDPAAEPFPSVGISDVLAINSKFQGVSTAIMKVRADIKNKIVDHAIGIDDVLEANSAFSGATYPNTADVCP